MTQSLEDLKAENLAAEQEEGKQAEQKLADAKLEEAKNEEESKEEKDPESKEEGEQESEGESKEGKEAWELSDEQTSEENDDDTEKKFTGGDVAAAKRKLKGKLQEKTEELDEWKEKYEALKAQGGKPVDQQESPAENKMPRLADFSYDEEQYGQAMAQWVQHNAVEATRADISNNSKADATKAAVEKTVKAVDDHYLRVDELTAKSNIAPEVYQAADTLVRKAVESVLPNSGDAVTDGLIERLGVGSEKVIYFLGRNKAKREEFTQLMREDSTGLSAAIMLGQLKTNLSGQKDKRSNAPNPSDQLGGDANAIASAGKLKREYDGTDDVQSRFDTKRKAKNAGIDVSGW